MQVVWSDGTRETLTATAVDLIKVKGMSSNSYWRPRSEGYDPATETVEKEGTWTLTGEDGRWIGTYENDTEMRTFLTFYMRAVIE